MNFTIWGVGYFCILINITEFCSGKFLETVLFFWALLLRFVRLEGGQCSGWSGVDYSQLLRKDIHVYSTQCPMNLEVSTLVGENRHYFSPLSMLGTVTINLLCGCSTKLGVFSCACTYQCSPEYQRGTDHLQMSKAVFVQLSSLQYSVLQILTTKSA